MVVSMSLRYHGWPRLSHIEIFLPPLLTYFQTLWNILPSMKIFTKCKRVLFREVSLFASWSWECRLPVTVVAWTLKYQWQISVWQRVLFASGMEQDTIIFKEIKLVNNHIMNYHTISCYTVNTCPSEQTTIRWFKLDIVSIYKLRWYVSISLYICNSCWFLICLPLIISITVL